MNSLAVTKIEDDTGLSRRDTNDGDQIEVNNVDKFDALINQLNNKFSASISLHCLPLSDYAISRGGIYEGRVKLAFTSGKV